MLPDLAHLIRLQAIESEVASASGQVASAPARIEALEATLAAARGQVSTAQQAIADNQAARRLIEKDLGAVQSRLSKYKDQLMEVKTNREYHTIQSEMATATRDIGGFEERILEGMMQLDEQTASLRQAENALKAEEVRVGSERAVIEQQVGTLRARLETLAGERDALLRETAKPAVELFYRISKGRNGVALSQAREERCDECRVRIRPMVFAIVSRNEQIVQCDSCQRILYTLDVVQPAHLLP